MPVFIHSKFVAYSFCFEFHVCALSMAKGTINVVITWHAMCNEQQIREEEKYHECSTRKAKHPLCLLCITAVYKWLTVKLMPLIHICHVEMYVFVILYNSRWIIMINLRCKLKKIRRSTRQNHHSSHVVKFSEQLNAHWVRVETKRRNKWIK